MTDLYNAFGRPVAKANDRSSELHLANGSRIVPLPGSSDTIVCYAANRLVLDEAARIPDLLYRLVRPMLAVKRGSLVALSTPFGRRGWWHKEWFHLDDNGNPRQDGTDEWKRVEVKASGCPRITEEFLQTERGQGHLYNRQEYCCEFVDTEESVFLQDQIDAAFRGDYAGWYVKEGKIEGGEEPQGAGAGPAGTYEPWYATE